MPSRARGPSLTVDAVWIHAGRLLAVRRKNPPFAGRWALPGGFVGLRETVEEAVVRELREETGLTARPHRLVGVYSGPRRDPRRSTATVAFLMRGRPGPPRGDDDAAEAAWLPLRSGVPLAFDHDQIVRDAERILSSSRRRAHRPRIA